MPWELQESDIWEQKLKKFKKKNLNETILMLNNLDTYFLTLNRGVNPINIKAGFIHDEPDGIKALDQKGTRLKGMGKPKQTRLYIFPDVETKQVHLITLGDKRTQSNDIQNSREYVRKLKSGG